MVIAISVCLCLPVADAILRFVQRIVAAVDHFFDHTVPLLFDYYLEVGLMQPLELVVIASIQSLKLTFDAISRLVWCASGHLSENPALPQIIAALDYTKDVAIRPVLPIVAAVCRLLKHIISLIPARLIATAASLREHAIALPARFDSRSLHRFFWGVCGPTLLAVALLAQIRDPLTVVAGVALHMPSILSLPMARSLLPHWTPPELQFIDQLPSQSLPVETSMEPRSHAIRRMVLHFMTSFREVKPPFLTPFDVSQEFERLLSQVFFSSQDVSIDWSIFDTQFRGDVLG